MAGPPPSERKDISRREFLKLAGLGTFGAGLAACAKASRQVEKTAEATATLLAILQYTATDTEILEKITPTPSPSPKPPPSETPQPTDIPPQLEIGPFTREQLDKQLKVNQAIWDFWSTGIALNPDTQVTGPLFVRGSTARKEVAIPDPTAPDDPSKVLLMFQVEDFQGGNMFTLPAVYATRLPEVNPQLLATQLVKDLETNKGNIPEGYGPLILTGVSSDSGVPVRRDEQTLMVTERINAKGAWELTPEGVVKQLGLNPGRTYESLIAIEAAYLVDVQSGLKVAVREGVAWRQTTDEERFGKMADSLGMPVFNWQGSGGEVGHPWDTRYTQTDINVVFTGYIEVVDWKYPESGEMIKDYRGLVVYRDPDGSIKKLWVSMFSPDMPGMISFRYLYPGPEERNTQEGVTVEEALKRYQPGQKWNVDFVSESPGTEVVKEECYQENGLCTHDYNRRAYLLAEQKEAVKVFVDSLTDDDGRTSTVPEGMVISPNWIRVRTDTLWEDR